MTVTRINKKAALMAVAALALCIAKPLTAAVLVPRGADWKFLDDGTDQGSLWREFDFNDSSWQVGAAQLGYGDDQATVISYGPDSTNKYITTYFRHTFSASDPSRCADLTISLLRDDGAVVYLNGREVFRSNMPGGAVNYRTRASSNVGGADESAYYARTIAATNLFSGQNVLAVEIHQASTNSSDVSFDLELVANPLPVSVTVLSPAVGSSGVSSTAQLSLRLDDVTSTNVVKLFGRPAGPPPGPDFTIIALPDTQYYVSGTHGGRPETFTAQTDWIIANKAARNIVFVTQLGDCVENGDNGGNPIEWLHATNAMYRLEDPRLTFAAEGIPYGIAVGNHDQAVAGSPTSTTTFYNQFFGEAHFSGRTYYGGHYGTNDNDNHFQLFSASGLDFIIVHVEFDPNQDTNVLDWVNGLLAAHPERRAIIVSHYIVSTSGNFGPQGRKLYDGLKANPNLFLMLAGHDPGEGRRSDTFNGNTVHSLLSDYQGRTNGGSGFLRILEFSPSNNVVRVKTYSPTFGQYETDADSQFTLEYDMRRGGAFTELGTFSDVCSATNLAAAWSVLSPGTTYEWCVEITDDARIQQSPIWQFTTAGAAGAAPIRLNLTRQPNGDLTFSWAATPGAVYQLVYREDLTTGTWNDLSGELTTFNSNLAWTTPIDLNAPRRFFAVRMVR